MLALHARVVWSFSVNLMAFCSCLHSVKFLAFACSLNEESVSGKHKFAAGATQAAGVTWMDSLLEIFGVTRGRPEVNHEFRKYSGLLLTLLPKQPLGTPTHHGNLPTPPSPPLTEHCTGRERDSRLHIPTYLIIGFQTLHPLMN